MSAAEVPADDDAEDPASSLVVPHADPSIPSRSSSRGKLWCASYYNNEHFEYFPVSTRCPKRKTTEATGVSGSLSDDMPSAVVPACSTSLPRTDNSESNSSSKDGESVLNLSFSSENGSTLPGMELDDATIITDENVIEVLIREDPTLTEALPLSSLQTQSEDLLLTCDSELNEGTGSAVEELLNTSTYSIPEYEMMLSGLNAVKDDCERESSITAVVEPLPEATLDPGRPGDSSVPAVVEETEDLKMGVSTSGATVNRGKSPGSASIKGFKIFPKKSQPVPLDPNYDKPGPSGLCKRGSRPMRKSKVASSFKKYARPSSDVSSDDDSSYSEPEFVDADCDSDFKDYPRKSSRRRKRPLSSSKSPRKPARSRREMSSNRRETVKRKYVVSSDDESDFDYKPPVHERRSDKQRKRKKKEDEKPWREDEKGLKCLKCNIHVDSSTALIAHLNVHCRNGFRFPGDACKQLLVRLSRLPESKEVKSYVEEVAPKREAIEIFEEVQNKLVPLKVKKQREKRPPRRKKSEDSRLSSSQPLRPAVPRDLEQSPGQICPRMKVPESLVEVFEDEVERCVPEERTSQRKFYERVSVFKPDEPATDKRALAKRNKELNKLKWLLDPYNSPDSDPEEARKDASSCSSSDESVLANVDQRPKLVDKPLREQFTVISNEKIVSSLCSCCGSRGGPRSDLVWCYVCCESFHDFCASPAPSPSQKQSGVFVCRSCLSCSTCGEKGNVEFSCSACFKNYHRRCIDAKLPDLLASDDAGWTCVECTPCQSCGGASGRQADYVILGRLYVCEECKNLNESNSLCQLCLMADDPSDDWYDINAEAARAALDPSLSALFCPTCKGKVHRRCEKLTRDEVRIMRENKIQ